MIKGKSGSTLLENVISIGILCIYIAVLTALTTNFLSQQALNNEFIKMDSDLQNSVEELVNKKYAEVAPGTTVDTINGFNRTITVTENSKLKEINITLSNEKGEMKLTAEKGQDIN